MTTEEVKLSRPLYNEVNGIRYGKAVPVDQIKLILEHNSKLDFDLIIGSRPKSGTTMLSHIVYSIMNDGSGYSGPYGMAHLMFEFTYSEFDINRDKLRVIVTHAPYSSLPNNNGKTKFIYVLRNPKDVIVSYYYHLKNNPTNKFFTGDISQTFNLFISGEVTYGDYFESCLEWLAHRNEPNFLFVLYENLVRNTREEIVRIAGFIDEKYRQKLMANDYSNSYMENVLKHCEIEHMREVTGKSKHPFFVRKGIIGDWRSHLSAEQSDIIDQKVNEKLSETGLPQIWKNDMMWENKLINL